MDESLVGDDKCVRNELTPASKSTTSMEFGNASEKLEVGKCDHFSIRGYVADVRKKDIKICWPFLTVNCPMDLEEQADVLPPLHVPEFRWWNCQSCLKRNDAIGEAKETAEIVNHDNNGITTSINACSHGNLVMSSQKDAPELLTGIQHSSKECIATVNDNGDEHEPSLHGEKKDKEAAPVCAIRDDIITFEGRDNGAEETVNPAIYGTIPCLTAERVTNEAEKININSNIDKHGFNSSGCETAIASKSVSRGKHVIEDLNVVPGNTSKHHSMELDKSDGESFGTDENIVRNNVQDEHCTSEDDNSSETLSWGEPRKQRLRSISDILRSDALGTSDRDAKTVHNKLESAHYKAARDASTEIDLNTAPKRRVTFKENDKNVKLAKKRRTKMPQDVDETPLQIIFPKDVSETAGISKGDAETRDTDTAIVHSESAADASVQIVLHPGPKSFLTECQNDRQLTLAKKKKVRPQFEVEESTLMPWQEGTSRELQILSRDVDLNRSGDEIIPYKAARDAFTGSSLHPDPKSYLAAESNGGKLILGKNKSVTNQFEDGQSSLMPLHEGMAEKDQIMRRHKGSSTIPSENTFNGRGVQHHAATKAIMYKNQKGVRRVEGRVNLYHLENGESSFVSRPEASSGTCNYENPNIQANPEVLRNGSNKRDKTTAELAAFDDIPMDIVELMAKNQHERRLFNAESTTENSYCLPGSAEKVKDPDPMNSTDVFGSETLRFLHKQNSRPPKSKSQSKGTGMHTGKRVVSTEQKPNGYPDHVNRIYNQVDFSRNLPEQSQLSMGFASFRPSWEKPTSGAQFPDTGSSINYGNLSSNWNGSMVGGSLESSEAYQVAQKVPQMTLNRKSFGFGSPQRFSAESSERNTVPQCLELFPLGNTHEDHSPKSVNPNDIHLENQRRRLDSDKGKRDQPEYPFSWRERTDYQSKTMGPLDLYSNEAIPALHLLRLMDAGVSSGTPAKQPAFPCDHHKLSGLEVRQSNNSEFLIHRPSTNSFNENHRPRKFGEHFPSAPMVNMVGSSLQKDDNHTRANGGVRIFSTNLLPISPKSQVREKKQSMKPPTQRKGLRSHRSVSRDGSAGKHHQFHDLQNGIFSASNSMPFPIQSRAMQGSSPRTELEVNKKGGTVLREASSSGTEICVLNRNPADFSVPEEGNVYMIGSGDFKRGKKKVSSRDGSGPTDRDGHKRQRKLKLTAIQEHGHN